MRVLLVALAITSSVAVARSAAAGKGAPAKTAGKGAPDKRAGKDSPSKPSAAAAAAGGKGAVPPTRPSAAELARYAEGARRFAVGDYAAAQQSLAPLVTAPLASRDALLYMLSTSEATQVPPAAERALGHFRALAAMQQSRYQALARARVADLLFDLGRFPEAAAAYAEVLRAPAPEVEPAVALFRLAEIAERAGRRPEALATWRRVFVEHPSHPLGNRALSRIRAALSQNDPAALVSPAEHIERARRLVSEHAWDRALEELGAISTEGLAGAVRDELDYQIGMTHFKMRHGYDIAAEKLLGVWGRLSGARQPEALFHGARAWSRSGDDDKATDKAIGGYKLVTDKFSGSKQAKEAHFLIGWLEFNRGRYAAGLPTLEEVATRDHSSFSDDAAWFAACSRWLMGDAVGALAGFEAYERLASGALGDGKARYWKGRALDKLGRRGEALAVWRAVVDAFPFSYYAQQARVRLLAAGDRTGPFGSRVPSSVTTPLAAADGEGAKVVAADPRVARVDELLAVGLGVEAAAELDRVDGALIKQYGAARTLPVLFDRYGRAEDFFHVHRLAEAHQGGALRRDPFVDPAARRWWELVYPLAYRRFVEKYGPTGHNPTYYLYTIMQKESAYNPHDLSYADAIGLLQMIPPTSRRVGDRIGRPYTDDVLYDPEGNIQFGAWYIGHLLEKFKGQVALGAGAFNAGPKAMMRWVKQNGARPLDEFVELCPYTQTREYMKKALEIYARYLWLYEGRDYLPDSTIDAAWLDDGIDY